MMGYAQTELHYTNDSHGVGLVAHKATYLFQFGWL